MPSLHSALRSGLRACRRDGLRVHQRRMHAFSSPDIDPGTDSSSGRSRLQLSFVRFLLFESSTFNLARAPNNSTPRNCIPGLTGSGKRGDGEIRCLRRRSRRSSLQTARTVSERSCRGEGEMRDSRGLGSDIRADAAGIAVHCLPKQDQPVRSALAGRDLSGHNLSKV
jgi:hypothetical protein